MKNKITTLGLALAVAAGVSSCNNNATTNETASSTDTTVSTVAVDTTTPMTAEPAKSDDAKLAYDLIESMDGGIALMKQGQEKATNPDVKKLAKKLETEHTKLNDELKALAEKKGWAVPAGESEDDAKKRVDMATEDTDKYQKDWLSALKDRHETNIKKLEDAKPADADLQAMGTKAVPKLHELLGSIEVVQKSIK